MAGCRLSYCCWPRRVGPAAAPVQWKTLRASISTTFSPETGWWNCEGIATDIATWDHRYKRWCRGNVGLGLLYICMYRSNWDWDNCTYVCIGRTGTGATVHTCMYRSNCTRPASQLITL